MAVELSKSQVCQSCGYPPHAGHSKSCSARSDESKDARDEGYKLFIEFLKKYGIDKMNKMDKIAKIREMDFNTIMQTVSRINGRLAFRDKRQEWSGKGANSIVRGGLDSIDNADLEPPENAELELKLFFEKMQADLDVENLREWAGKIYFAIIFAHAFENGNGRTARNIYHLLRKDGPPPQNLAKGRVKEVQVITKQVSLAAMTRLFDDRGIPCRDQVKVMQAYGASVEEDDWPLHGDMGYLKFLAAREALKQSGRDVNDLKIININKLDEGQKVVYRAAYKDLKREWFWKIFEVCDDYKDAVTEDLGHLLENSTNETS